MGVGILSKKIVSKIPAGDGEAVTLKDASDVPGVKCEIHGQELGVREFFALMRRPGGLDACAECIGKIRAPRSGGLR